MSSLTCDATTVTTDRDDSLSCAVIDAVAEAEGVDPTEIPPLYTAVDPEALDSLFQSPHAGGAAGVGRVQFAYYGYDVTVSADGQVTLAE